MIKYASALTSKPYETGQNLFTKGDKASLAVMDKQIYRIIGKAITLAACASFTILLTNLADSKSSMAYRVRQGRNFVPPPAAPGTSYTGS